ncbi:mitogen-activated protein kinase organizer, putative [Entamoeba invadens IP1]|uniref:Mitogen-activated protein kinase organizer, putative n=1 Tax=Entamoeba invadens IP1 TaxID=370355 RepID=A0A0A1U027_ENTIV|nr:mitogen-activated protein kinase organizer, putative [Entamoeba invadens IP1]ELP87242.1 mitogen-activated protein kinase organizer, putative [Entamoeba invadens IP1]|eukprot:XP_004254013.1 mitogen-activated protein kinase organizer, putative [Entamoeba invadens IP1]
MKSVNSFEGSKQPIYCVKYTQNGKYILSGGEDRSIKLWNAESFKMIQTYNSPCREVLDFVITRDNGKVGCGGNEGCVYMIDLASSNIVRKYGEHGGRVNCVSFNEEENVLLSGSYDMKVYMFDLIGRQNTPIFTFCEAKDAIESIQVVQELVYTISVDGCLRCYDLRKGLLTTDNINKPLTGISIINNKTLALSSSFDSTITIFNRALVKTEKVLKSHVNKKFKIPNVTSMDKTIIFTGDEEGYLVEYFLPTCIIYSSLCCVIQHNINGNSIRDSRWQNWSNFLLIFSTIFNTKFCTNYPFLIPFLYIYL